MIKIFLLCVMGMQLLFGISVDLVDIYRKDGIIAIEQLLQKQLTKKSYWENHLKNKQITYGYYESIEHVMVCQKNMKDITLFNTRQNKKLFHSSVFTGEIDGDKKIEGDLKTPVGAYKLLTKRTNLDPFYGPLALTTNYPNIYDKTKGKTGHGIWIHGLPEKEERDEYTQGCIALDNTKIQELDKSINIKNSVLIISEENFRPALQTEITTVLSNIFQWRDAWKYSDIKTYLSFYDDEFKKSDGQNLEQFSKFKTRLFKRDEDKTIQFSNINIIPYPNDMGKIIYKVIMDELYQTKTYKFNGKKELYVEVVDGKIQILAES